MDLETYKAQFVEDEAVGWLAIDGQLEKIYREQEPRHYGTFIGYKLGGDDPIDGTSVYDSNKGEEHLHYVSYGMSKLYYDEESAGKEYSGWGFEFTFRLKKNSVRGKDDPAWVISMMNNLARYVFESGKHFDVNHFIPANGKIALEEEIDLVGIIFAEDPELGRIQTPHGEVIFLQMVGVTQEELDELWEHNKLSYVGEMIQKMKKDNPYLITDLARKSI